jgi:hypothetical protein
MKSEHQELRELLEQRLVAKYGSLENVKDTNAVRAMLRDTARDYFEMKMANETRPQVVCRVETAENVIRISGRVELRAPHFDRQTRRLAKKKCKVVDLTAWRLARGR